MNDLILAKMREGYWGEVVRLMREATRMHDKSASFVKGNGLESVRSWRNGLSTSVRLCCEAS